MDEFTGRKADKSRACEGSSIVSSRAGIEQLAFLWADLVNLENGAEERKMPGGEFRPAIMNQREKPAFSLEDFETGVVSVSPGWLKEVWNKRPGDETIEELLALLDDGE